MVRMLTLLNSATMDFKIPFEGEDKAAFKHYLNELIWITLEISNIHTFSLDDTTTPVDPLSGDGGTLSVIRHYHSIIQARCRSFIWSAVSLDINVHILSTKISGRVKEKFPSLNSLPQCEVIATHLDSPAKVPKNGHNIEGLLKSGRLSSWKLYSLHLYTSHELLTPLINTRSHIHIHCPPSLPLAPQRAMQRKVPSPDRASPTRPLQEH
jgi:hypothetical protein